jgi:predicted MFS family arabinose efflux permease
LDTVGVEVGPDFLRYLKDALERMANRKILGLFLVSMLTFIVLYGAYSTFIPLLLADRFDSSPWAIGLIMTVGSLSTAATASRLGALGRRFQGEDLIISAFALYAISFLVIPMLPGHWWVALPVALFGIAQGLNYPVVMTLLAGLASTEHRGIFMSVNGMVLRTGQTLGPIIMAGVFAWGGMASVFYAASGICLGVFLGIPAMIRGRAS